MKVIAVFSMKGGVGKTSIAVNLAWEAAHNGLRVLLADLDAQGAASFYFGLRASDGAGAKHLVKGDDHLSNAIQNSQYDRLDILPADFSYRNLAVLLEDKKRSRRRLAEALENLHQNYDLIFLDCPAALDLQAEAAIVAADCLLLPLIPTTLSLETLRKTLQFLKQEAIGPKQKYAVFALADRRKKMHQDIIAGQQTLAVPVLNTIIPYSSEIERMGIQQKPVGAFAPRSKSRAAFKSLWLELAPLAGLKPAD